MRSWDRGFVCALGVAVTFLVASIAGCEVFAQPPEPPAFSVAASPAAAVPMSETECNVTLIPSAGGWSLTRIVPDYVGTVCSTAPTDIRWRHANDLDYGKTLVLIVEGRHTSGVLARVAVTVTMEPEPEADPGP